MIFCMGKKSKDIYIYIVGVCCRERLPASQLVQVDELDAPVLDEYLPESIVVREVKERKKERKE